MSKEGIYLDAARTVASCSKERLPLVLNLLKKGGVEFTDEEIRKIQTNRFKSDSLELKRKNSEHIEWDESDDPCVLALREAYNSGVSFTVIGRELGVSRALIYLYLRGERQIPEYRRSKIIEALGADAEVKPL